MVSREPHGNIVLWLRSWSDKPRENLLKGLDMSNFSYKAAERGGKVVTGTLEAKDKAGAIEMLRSSNLFPIEVLKDEKQKWSLDISLERVSNKDVMLFTQQLSSLLNAGLSLDRSFSVVVELIENKKLTEIVKDIQKNIQGGSSFADSLAKYPKLFSRLYINMVRAGESGGVLELVIERLADFLESFQALKEEITSAMIYPILLSLVAASAVTILMTFVIPKFAELFSGMGRTLPMSTQILMSMSDFITEFWWAFVLGGVVLYGMFQYFVSKDEGRIAWDGFLLRVPLIGTLIQKIEVARFSRTLGTLISSGVPILTGLNIVREVIGNRLMSESMREISSGIREGEGISGPLIETKLFPPMALHMISIGEETGNLDKMLLKVAERFDGDVRSAVKRLIALLEPAMILIMGGIVAFIVVSMLMAIFSINEMSL